MPPTRKAIGYFTNILQKVNEYAEREQKSGSDIPRFTKTQIRLIARWLERRELFRFGHAIDCQGGTGCSCERQKTEEFLRAVYLLNRRLPRAVIEMFI